MKRFVTYLYEYENGVKAKSMGFIRVDIRGIFVNMEICIRKFLHSHEIGKVYALVPLHGLKGIFLGEIKILGGQGDLRLQLSAEHLQDTNFSIHDLAGVGICFSNESYLASCWMDEYASEIGRGSFQDIKMEPQQLEANESKKKEVQDFVSKQPIENEQLEVNESKKREVQDFVSKQSIETQQLEASESKEKELQDFKKNFGKESYPNIPEIAAAESVPTLSSFPQNQYRYRKIDLTHMREIPPQDRHYSSNAFLIHGFWNYGYLIIKTEMENNQKKLLLGVPGIYERQEAAMAMAFGFSKFETLPEEMIGEKLLTERVFSLEENEKNQHPKEKTFGCWFTKLHT